MVAREAPATPAQEVSLVSTPAGEAMRDEMCVPQTVGRPWARNDRRQWRFREGYSTRNGCPLRCTHEASLGATDIVAPVATFAGSARYGRGSWPPTASGSAD